MAERDMSGEAWREHTGMSEPRAEISRQLQQGMRDAEEKDPEPVFVRPRKSMKIRTIRKDMIELVDRAHVLVRELSKDPEILDPHCEVCGRLAEEFGLWEVVDNDPGDPEVGPMPDIEKHFPVWLSRVVEGVISDEVEAGRLPPGAGACGYEGD